MKAVIINNVKQGTSIKDYVDAYLLPIDNLSVNYLNTFSVEEIKEIIKLGKEVFVIVNKNIHNDELDILKDTLIKLDSLNIKGIIFYDIALINLKKKLNLKTDLVWNQEHLVTNYGTINYYYDKGVKYAYLSSELTKREIEEIKKNTKAKLFVNVFGYVPMFTSKRHLVKNYLDTFNLKGEGSKIYKEGKYYNIIDNEKGTTVYTDYILNCELDVDYLVYNSNFIEESAFKEILKGNNKFDKELGFLDKETIYKVK